jgi:hypothetical protein
MSIPLNYLAALVLYVPDLIAVLRVLTHVFATAIVEPPVYFSGMSESYFTHSSDSPSYRNK